MDSHYPTVCNKFLISMIENSGNVESLPDVGKTKSYLTKGSSPIHKRLIVVRSNNVEVDYNFASSIAIKTKTLPELINWLEENKDWKEGAYVEK